jgi:hypothetical protein
LLARQMLKSGLMDKPPLLFKLFLWLLKEARYTDQVNGNLKRGQLFTTISEMQDAMSHKIGYRKKTPSRDQIRKSYESLTKAAMITTMKTTRKLIITICDYDYYQNPKNYEPHTEAHTESARRPNSAHTIKKKVERKGKKGGRQGLHPLPDDFELKEKHREWAIEKGYVDLNLDFVTEKFIDYYRGNGKAYKDWDAVWRNWVRGEHKPWGPAPETASEDDLQFHKAKRNPKK